MSKFRAAVIAFTLAVMFFIPMTAAFSKEEAETGENEISQNTSSEAEKKPFKNEAETQNKTVEGFFRIYDIETEKISEVSFEEYVKGAIASEMGAGFEEEALIAQGIAAFSYGLYQKGIRTDADYDFSAAPDKKLGYMTEEKAKETYGGSFEKSWEKISKAAEKSMNYVLAYNGKPALAVYHAISAGKTESAENVWGGYYDYLVSVESPGDIISEDYETAVSIGKDEALKILNASGAGLSGKNPEEWFEGEVLTEAGYVDYIKIGAATFSGEKLRSIFGLRSAAFETKYENGEFIFTVRGYGHGVGLSQVGANEMAKNGADFEEILKHYYPGTEILKYGEIY